MNVKLPKVHWRKFEELLESYFPGTKKAINQVQEKFNYYISQKKLIKKLKRFHYKKILQELLIWLSPFSNVDRIEKNKRFFYQKDNSLITDLVGRKGGDCIAFTSLFIALSRRMSIKVWAANVLLSADNKDFLYDLKGHVCVIDKSKICWDCLYLEDNKPLQHKKVEVLTDEQLISSIITHEASIFENKRNSEELLKEAIKLDPRNIHALMNLGAYYSKNNFHPISALKIYKKVVEIDHNHSRAWRRIGEQYENLEKVNKAISSYERSVSIKPTIEPLFRLIKLYYKKEDYENALTTCLKYLELEPNSVGMNEKYKELLKKKREVRS